MTRGPVASLVLVAVLAASCSAGEARPVASPTATPSAPPSDGAPTAPAVDPIVASWDQGAPATELPDGWILRDCEGDAPIVCVERDGDLVGTLAYDTYPLEGLLEDVAPDGDATAALRAHARMRMEGLVDDRAIGCGDGYEGRVDDLVDVRVGGQPGVRSGFTGTQDGAVAEHVVTYATVADGRLWLLVAEAAADGTCMADSELELFSPSDLDAFLPVLDRVVAGTPVVDPVPTG